QAGILAERSGDNNHFGAPMAGQNYESAWANWRAHSIYITQNYPNLFQHGDRVEDWAAALADSPYTSDPNYELKLMQLIEHFQLRELDR
ncbi:MAG TPA: glucosaminidase domain-containing protein, partial [Phaeodactylibacter sp.]|nr:glucosaminidase domain-containing protein [Phaeodactylibacter sp.]